MLDKLHAVGWTTTPELFEDLSDSVCQSILSTSYQRNIPCLDVIFCAGDTVKRIFLLIEGRVKVSQVSKNGSEVILWLNVPGQTIGSLNLTPGYAHSSTAEAVQDCKVLVWELPMFEASLERFPPLFRNVQAIMVRQIDELSRRICEISTGTVAPRLAHGLLRLIGQIGREVKGDVELNLTQETLAEMTATTFYTVCRQLAEWERRGLVFRRKYTIVIRDLSGLRRFCGNSTISPS